MSRPNRIVPITPPRLRTMGDEDRRTATWLELFYDLAYVVAVAVLTNRLYDEGALRGLGSFAGYFTLLWWLWASHTFYADRFDTDDFVYRLLAAAQMVAVVVLAASLSSGPASSTLAFAVAYAFARLTLLAMYLRAHRHVGETKALTRGYLVGFGVGAALWVASATVPEPVRFALWGLALVIDLATPWIMRREQARVPLDVSHLPERFGLFTILVLGESIAAVTAGLSRLGWSLAPSVTMALGIGIASALWWMYFENAEGTVVRRSDLGARRTWRPTGWIYTHMPLAMAMAGLGVGLERSVSDAGTTPMVAEHKWLLIGSVAIALASLALIQSASQPAHERSMFRSLAVNRLVGLLFVVLIGAFSGLASQWVAAGVLGVCAAVLVADLAVGGAA